MRSFLATTCLFALPLAFSARGEQHGVSVLEHNPETAYTRFAVPCPSDQGCSFGEGVGPVADDESMVFEVKIDPTGDLFAADIRLNGRRMRAGPDDLDEAMTDSSSDASSDLAEEMETLGLLEAKANDLHQKIMAKKQSIAHRLKEDRSHVSVCRLLQECDSLACKAQVVAQRIYDKVGITTDPTSGFAKTQNQRLLQLIDFEDEQAQPQQKSRNHTKTQHFVQMQPSSHNTSAQGVSVPLMLTKNSSAIDYRPSDLTDPSNPLVRALVIIATVLGLVALFKLIRRKCMSVRSQVERAADREERRNARAYRKAARRAKMRRRWDNIVSNFSCFRSAPEPRIEDYEEKRALILQDAFLEQLADLEQAEKGEIMEAEIRELRHAHEIVASLVRAGEDRYDLIRPMNDPPPPLVPLPYTPETRSRASTGTLPSYTSESLPDYSSGPPTLAESNFGGSIDDGSTHYTQSTSAESSDHCPPTSVTSSSARTRYTPTSSVLDVSPRVSDETMRTMPSRDIPDL